MKRKFAAKAFWNALMGVLLLLFMAAFLFFGFNKELYEIGFLKDTGTKRGFCPCYTQFLCQKGEGYEFY